MPADTFTDKSPVLYIPHGGGPLPLLGDVHHRALVDFLQKLPGKLGRPSAILLISAHWEEEVVTITSGAEPALIYDYYGFPDEAYELKYPAKGDPGLSVKIGNLLEASGIETRLDEQRGFDHGMFVPLKLMYPQADIPCVQLSLRNDMDAASHIALGKSLAALRQQNILIIGSGLSFHNMQTFFASGKESKSSSIEFDNWLVETCTSNKISTNEREQRLLKWQDAPSANFCHPREEHLLPLHVCYGIACKETAIANLIFNDDLLGHRVSGLLWH